MMNKPSLWSNYCTREVDQTVSENERMTAPSIEKYMSVGHSAIRCITASQFSANVDHVARIMDFGCGHGRVIRHLRAFAPDAEIFAADVREDGVEFCASQFGCKPIVLQPEFGTTVLPALQDIIFVGSVFTHIDYARQKKLWSWLFNSLAPKGMIVATFHGRYARALHETDVMKFISEEKWHKITRECDTVGCGYASYGIKELGDWGVSLNTPASLFTLAEQSKSSRIVHFSEYGWAGIQDVISWQRLK